MVIKKIQSINFGFLSPEHIRKMSVINIETPDTYGVDGYPIPYGLMDPHLGVIDPSLKCWTCGFRGGECQGHFGSINLARPVIHVGFGDVIHKILRSTCNKCGRVLLTPTEIEEYTVKIKEFLNHGVNLNDILKEVYDEANKEKINGVCPYCGEKQEPITFYKPTTFYEGKYQLTPTEVREKLERISDEDIFVLGINPEVARPEWLVLTVLPVPSVIVRPSITLNTGERSEDDLTHKLVDILRINQRLIENIEAGAPPLIVEDLWELLQYHVTTYFDNEVSGVPPARHRSGRPLKTLSQRLKGKEGRFRKNLSGKRVYLSGRSIISPDSNISINEVGVPELIAKKLTVSVKINDYNIDQMKKLVKRGPDNYPGANFVIDNQNELIEINKENQNLILENFKQMSIIERHLVENDIVLLNYQPSLKKNSILAHSVKISPFNTLTLNPVVCNNYGCDFDGDEMNIHVLQKLDVNVEAKELMSVQKNLKNPRDSSFLIGAVEDIISGIFILTHKSTKFKEETVFQILYKSNLLNNVNRKNRNWIGKELFSLLLPNDLNLYYRSDFCLGCEKCYLTDCYDESFIFINNGELISGIIDEKGIGVGVDSGILLNKILNDYGSTIAKNFIESLSHLAYAVLRYKGITFSLHDLEFDFDELNFIRNKLEKIDIKDNENNIKDSLFDIRSEVFDFVEKNVNKDSTFYLMARSGARVSFLNMFQILGCLGQQIIRNNRFMRSYKDRTFPHFKKYENSFKSKGFISSNYSEGLDPIEYFINAASGRDSLILKNISVAQTGYLQRRLIFALADLKIDKKYKVTDAQNKVIQLLYGEDGVDVKNSYYGSLVDIDELINDIKLK